MKYLNTRLIYSLIFYLLVVALIIVSKPEFMFDANRVAKPFGLGPEKSIFSFGVIISTVSILSYYIFATIDLLFAYE